MGPLNFRRSSVITYASMKRLHKLVQVCCSSAYSPLLIYSPYFSLVQNFFQEFLSQILKFFRVPGLV